MPRIGLGLVWLDLADWLAGWLAGSLAGWLAGWLAGGLTGGLAGWLACNPFGSGIRTNTHYLYTI